MSRLLPTAAAFALLAAGATQDPAPPSQEPPERARAVEQAAALAARADAAARAAADERARALARQAGREPGEKSAPTTRPAPDKLDQILHRLEAIEKRLAAIEKKLDGNRLDRDRPQPPVFPVDQYPPDAGRP